MFANKLDYTDDFKSYLLNLARKAINSKINNLDFIVKEFSGEKGAVFVTLTANKKLRGCIGSFYFEDPIETAIIEMAQKAAFNDTRFSPITENDLIKIKIEISVLSVPKKINDIEEIKIGRDGLYLLHPQGRGVLLPIVAERYSWSAAEFLEQTSLKAGLKRNAWQDKQTELLTFTAQVFAEK